MGLECVILIAWRGKGEKLMFLVRTGKHVCVAAALLALLGGTSAFAFYQSPSSASRTSTTVLSPAGPVTYHQGYRVLPDGRTEPVLARSGYVVNSHGAIEPVTTKITPAAPQPVRTGPVQNAAGQDKPAQARSLMPQAGTAQL